MQPPQMYEVHLVVPKRPQLTHNAVGWLFAHGHTPGHPEAHWPVKRLKPKALARWLLRFDRTLLPMPGVADDVELYVPDERLGLVFYLHERGVVAFFPLMGYSTYSRAVLGLAYTYFSFLAHSQGFWAYDPQLNVVARADDYRTLEAAAVWMDALLPQALPDPSARR